MAVGRALALARSLALGTLLVAGSTAVAVAVAAAGSFRILCIYLLLKKKFENCLFFSKKNSSLTQIIDVRSSPNTYLYVFIKKKKKKMKKSCLPEYPP
jgi:hypothetical protein